MGDTGALSALTLVSSSASVLGGICLIVTHYKIKALQYGLRNILCFLTISDILTSSGYIAGAVNSMIESSGGKYSDVVCKAQSFLTTFSNLASFSWTSMIAVHLYLLVVTPMDWDKKKSLKVVYHIIGWLIPAFITVLMLNNLGRSDDKTTGSWCWIRTSSPPQTMQIVAMLISGKLWEILTYTLSFVLFVQLKMKAYAEKKNDRPYRWHEMVANLSSFRPEDARLCYIWLPLYLLRVWGTVRFFVAISYPGHLSDSHNLLLLYLQCVGDSSHALVNFILFCVFDKEIRITYGKACMRWVCARKADAGESLEVQLTVSVRYQSIEPLSNLMQSKNT